MSESFHSPPRTSRRKFLGVAAGGAAAAVGGAAALRTNRSDLVPGEPSASTEAAGQRAAPTSPPRPLAAHADVKGRTLVVIELQGGYDGLATLVPRNAGTLYDRREAVHIPDE